MALNILISNLFRMGTELRHYAYRLPSGVTLGALWFIGILFLMTNAQAVYGGDYDQWRNLLMVYMLSLALFWAATNTGSPLFQVSLAEGAVVFGLAFAVASLILFSLPFPAPTRQALGASSFAIVMTHVLVVAVSEEALFREAIPALLPLPPFGAQLVAAVMFGFFHWTAYGAALSAIAFAVVAGILFGLIKESFRNGLLVSIAFHAAWNLWSLGVLTVLFIGGGAA